MAYIQLTQSKTAQIDDSDVELVEGYKWHYTNTGYAAAKQYMGGGRKNQKSKTVLLHRLILNAPKGKQVDHINGDRLDNRRSNLRLCSSRQNIANSKGYSKITKYKGIDSMYGKWRARININSKKIHLGMFNTEEEAAEKYNEAALKYHGAFARLNKVGRIVS